MAPVHSMPEHFSLVVAPGEARASHSCWFSIPNGRWESGTWEVIGAIPSGTPFARKAIGADPIQQSVDAANPERYRLSGPVGTAALSAMNRAPGGTFMTEMIDTFAQEQPEGATDIVVACTLTLFGTPNPEIVTPLEFRYTTIFDPAVFKFPDRRGSHANHSE